MTRIFLNNVIIIGATKQNMGKTYVACKIIEQLSASTSVIGVKISPHFHNLLPDYKKVVQNDNYIIVEDTVPSNKDSYLMKKSGASTAYYIQCKSDEYVFEAFNFIYSLHSSSRIIVESGGLIKHISPAKFILINDEDPIPTSKKYYLEYNPIIVKKGFAENLDNLQKILEK